MLTPNQLAAKYATNGPRYTSYPPVPMWDDATFSPAAWEQRLIAAVEAAPGRRISLYVHLPYCESLCTFCGCNRQITKKHEVETPYIQAVLDEWAYWRSRLPTPAIAELHLGGGTPSFFSPANLARLIDGLLADTDALPDAAREFGFEGHPESTTEQHLASLRARGFTRLSLGVQDYAPLVQSAIHRFQSAAQVRAVTEAARRIGYRSVSHDLVYGLPKQTLESLRKTLEATIEIRPDRIAFYSYAHVPWIGGTGQRGFDEADLPTPERKLAMYVAGRERLMAAGYVDIGMDHFALPHDDLAAAAADGTLHRNFMGYTTRKTEVLVGLGASSISDCGTAFAQNEKHVAAYVASAARPSIVRGHLMTESDTLVRDHIARIMCHHEASWAPDRWPVHMRDRIASGLAALARDGAVTLTPIEGTTTTRLSVTAAGKPLLRNVCMLFDPALAQPAPDQRARFSATL